MRTFHTVSAALAAASLASACVAGSADRDPAGPSAGPASRAPAVPSAPPEGPDHHPRDAGWTLVWSDEFDGEELDRTKWRPEVSCWGGGNDERQCYTDRPQNVQVVNGVLRLIALEEARTGPEFPPEFGEDGVKTQPYTSGKVRTRGLADWRYGRFEVRAKPPAGQGMWAAVWMMPIENHYGGWPLSGEIDILETVNLGASCDTCEGDVGENRSIAALHFGEAWPDNSFVDARVAPPDAALPSDGYHVWAAEWGEGVIRFFLDGTPYFTVTRDEWSTASPLASGNPNAPFDRPFYVMANLAVGGGLAERNNDKGLHPSSIPNQFLIDWVRIYQCQADPDTGLACMQAEDQMTDNRARSMLTDMRE